MKLILVLLMAIVASCSKPTAEVVRILEGDGCVDVVDNGASIIFDGCSDQDGFNNQFTCTKSGRMVEGVVCSGWFKGYTIRYY